MTANGESAVCRSRLRLAGYTVTEFAGLRSALFAGMLALSRSQQVLVRSGCRVIG
jgi:hypothetical protein